jgi:hypothetical protein
MTGTIKKNIQTTTINEKNIYDLTVALVDSINTANHRQIRMQRQTRAQKGTLLHTATLIDSAINKNCVGIFAFGRQQSCPP